MRSALIAIAGALTLGAIAPPAAAQSASDRDDVRCIVVLTAVSRDPKQKEDAAKGTFYYLGRLDARGMTPKLGQMLVAEAKGIPTAAQATMELKRCANELTQRGKALDGAYAQARAASPKPAATPPAKKK